MEKSLRKVAFFISCDSFEGFYGGTFGITRDFFVQQYRNDFVWDYALGLRKQGHEIVIYVLSYGQPELCHTQDGLQVRFLPLPPWLRTVDRLLWRLRSVPHMQAVRARIAYAAYGDAFQQALKEDAIDVVYHQEVWSSRFDLIVEKTALPVVGADHGARFFEWMRPAKRISFARAAAVTIQTAEDKHRATELGGTIIFLPNGVDTHFFSPGSTLPEQRGRTLLAVGRLVEQQKRFADLLHALVELPEFTLTLVGSGPAEATLKSLAAKLGIADRVAFAGFVSDRAVLRELYRNCGVFVSTSAWEMVALVLLEAMSCGAPVVATRIASFEAMLAGGEGGVLVPVGAPQELAAAIRSAYDQRQHLSRGARATVLERFSSDAVYHRLSQLLEQV